MAVRSVWVTAQKKSLWLANGKDRLTQTKYSSRGKSVLEVQDGFDSEATSVRHLLTSNC